MLTLKISEEDARVLCCLLGNTDAVESARTECRSDVLPTANDLSSALNTLHERADTMADVEVPERVAAAVRQEDRQVSLHARAGESVQHVRERRGFFQHSRAEVTSAEMPI